MIKEYEILPGLNGKEIICYYEGGTLVTTELYSQPGFTAEIKQGYINRNRVKWVEMLDALMNSGAIATKMRTATGMSSNLAFVFALMNMGVMGYPNEQGLQALLRLSGWGFIQGEKDTINNYFTNNGFNISV
jgi:hypothetical protein